MLRAVNTRKRSFACLEEEVQTAVEFDNSIPRSGKWSTEEEYFANKLIAEFEAGSLTDCVEGCTLRSYLAKHLNCAPMRISKKFAGQCIGKHTFTRRERADTLTTDVESCSLSTASADSAEHEELEPCAAEHKLHATMSFDTFTQFERYHAELVIPQSFLGQAPCATTGTASELRPILPTANFWSTYATLHPQSHILPHLKKHLQYTQVHGATPSASSADPAVGLDLDLICEQAAGAMMTATSSRLPRRATAEVTPDPPMPTSYLAKVEPGAELSLSRMSVSGPRPEPAPARAPAPSHPACNTTAARTTPTLTLRSGAAVFVPVPAAHGGWGQQTQPVPDTARNAYCGGANEAEEWREVLTYFCGHTLTAWQYEPAAAATAMGAKSASYSSLSV